MVLGFASRAIVIGGAGALGRAMVSTFKRNWEVTSIDLAANPDAKFNVTLSAQDSHEAQLATALSPLKGKYNAILCVAGGFTMGAASSPDIFAQCDAMLRVNLYPSLMAAHLATQVMEDNGLLLFTGAATPFKSAVPDLLAYAIAKNAVHSLALNMAARTDLPSVATVLTILPTMIDTPKNREAMPEADRSSWLSTNGIAALVKKWADGKHTPENGSYLLLKNEKGAVVPEFV